MNKILLIVIGTTIILLVINFIPLIPAQDISSKVISSEGITSITEELDGEFVFKKIKKIYEISDSSLEKGYSATLNEKDAFRIKIKERDYYIIVWNISDDNRVRMIFPGERQLIFGVDEIILVDIDQDYKLDVQLELKAIVEDYGSGTVSTSIELENETATIKDTEYIPNKKANLYIQKIVEKELIPSGDYFELFDVTVRLAEEEIRTARDLTAFIIFENFGEGTSEIDIVYSIINERGGEVYRGVDSKIVQTEDRVVKDFDFLTIPTGKYILRTEIFYGQNQTGESEQDFEIIKVPLFSRLSMPILFISTIVILFIAVKYGRRIYKKNRNIKIKKGGQKDEKENMQKVW